MAPWKPLGISISAVLIFSGLAYLLFPSTFDPIRQQDLDSTTLSKHRHKHFQAPARNPWSELDDVEATQIYTFIHEKAKWLNLTKDFASAQGGNQNYLI